MRAGDEAIYAKYSDELVRFATVLVGPWAAEDVVADAVTRAISSSAWPAVANHRAYLFRVTLNQARQAYRGERRRMQRERRFTSPTGGSDVGVRIEVLQAMSRLSTRQRGVIFFTYWHDLSNEEVAELLQISKRTVQRELTAARRRLEVLLDD